MAMMIEQMAMMIDATAVVGVVSSPSCDLFEILKNVHSKTI
jgi:hypothetical protein